VGTSTYSGTATGGQQVAAPWVELIEGDCLEEMARLPAGSVDMILCDLPYGTTQNAWDSVIPFEPMWAEFWRVCTGAVVLTATQPFSSALVMSQPKAFKHEWLYVKSHPVGHLNANRAPLRKHESVLVFAQGGCPYYPQKTPKPKKDQRPPIRGGTSSSYGAHDPSAARTDAVDVSFPNTLLHINTSPTGGDKGLHPTQKPVKLFEYLIRTYSQPGQTVLDATAGSGTTGVAARNTGRNAILIEKDPAYYDIASERLWPSQKEAAE